MNPQDRIKEFTTRQIWNASSMVIKLNKKQGEPWYSVYAWINQGKQDTKFLVIMDKYNGQDPEELIKLALAELNIKKLKLGVPII